MGSESVYPHSNAECVTLLSRLGFVRKRGIGNAKHPYKYVHPSRKHGCINDKPFVLITHYYFDELGKKLMKKIECWGFTSDEVKEALRRV